MSQPEIKTEQKREGNQFFSAAANNSSPSQDNQLSQAYIQPYFRKQIQNRGFFSSVCQIFTSLSYNLELFWNEIFPQFIRGSTPLLIQEYQPKFAHLFKKEANVIKAATLENALQVCKNKGKGFFLFLFSGQSSLIEINKKVCDKLVYSNYPIVPIDSKSKQILKLDIDIENGGKYQILFCYYSKSGQLLMVSKACIDISEEDIEAWILASELDLQDYIQAVEGV